MRCRRTVTGILLAALAVVPSLSAQSTPRTAARATGDRLPIALDGLLHPVVVSARVPAMGAALVTHQGVLAIGAAGRRDARRTERVTRDDQWHIGSCGKAISAVVVARLVAKGVLRWESTVAELWPDSARHPAWNAVTVEQLLSHRGGMSANPDDALWEAAVRSNTSLPAQRARVARGLFAAAPTAPVDSVTLYSNAAYLAVGAMVERRTGVDWELLVRREVFHPLAMRRSGFGAPRVPRPGSQARGHIDARSGVYPVRLGVGSDNPPAGGPVGTIHLPLDDWSTFIATVLRGARGDTTYLPAAQWQRLLTPRPNADYALGWKVVRDSSLQRFTLEHVGSNGFWIAQASLSPDAGIAVLLTANAAVDRLEQPFDRLRRLLADSASAWCVGDRCRGATVTR
ncbi:MAG: beta-lactamase family protein [Gemmatimonadaceae bacterium]|jgi:CubicO group peptidase (beta-lactamase class C family)|nr:beta-lactamase family protein [Gemmatimonadaceae bacterium]